MDKKITDKIDNLLKFPYNKQTDRIEGKCLACGSKVEFVKKQYSTNCYCGTYITRTIHEWEYERKKGESKQYICRKCEDTGILHYKQQHGTYLYKYAKPCTCFYASAVFGSKVIELTYPDEAAKEKENEVKKPVQPSWFNL